MDQKQAEAAGEVAETVGSRNSATPTPCPFCLTTHDGSFILCNDCESRALRQLQIRKEG